MTKDSAIVVENLAKQYRIGGKKIEYKTLTDAFQGSIQSMFRSLRRNGKLPASQEVFWALRDVSFQVNAGEVLGVIGRNGAGKSTLLKILSRITKPTEGQFYIMGRVGSLLEVGTGFHPELTGRENIYMNGTILGMRRQEIDRKFDEIVAFSEIEKFLDTPVKRYSSGMYIRLAFSVAAHLEPEILIIDEVLAVGDVAFQKKCLGKMNEVSKGDKRTVLFVSHSMPMVKALCDRVIWLDQGRIRMEGNTDEVIAAYLAGDIVSTSGLVPTDATRYDYHTHEGLLMQVILMDEDKQPIQQVFLGQSFYVALIFDVKTSIGDAVVEVGICTLDGLRVATALSTDKSGDYLSMPQGRQAVMLRIDATFLPNDYAVEVGLHHSSGATVDWIDRSFTFSALRVARSGSDSYRPIHSRGFIRLDSMWHPLVSISSDEQLQPDHVPSQLLGL